MDNKQTATVLQAIMQVPGLILTDDSSVMIEEGHDRDLVNTRLRFLSNKGVNDNDNGIAFTTYMRDKGVVVDARSRRSVTVRSDDLIKMFC